MANTARGHMHFRTNPWLCTSITGHCFFVGSPADKADLEVGDEILEVNGKSLEDATHTEVISHIHQVGDDPPES